MKKIFTSFALCACFVAAAQEKVKEPVEDDYQRNSLSIVVIERGDNFDSQVFNAVRSIDFGDKFDMNYIPTNLIAIHAQRSSAIGQANISNAVEQADLGKEIVSYWFDRTADGRMSAARMIRRGKYNADDQDLMNAKAAKVGPEALGDTGSALVKRSYATVLDYSGISSTQDSQGKTTWSVTTHAYVYQIDYTQDIEAQINAAWVYEDDSREVIAQKKRAYDQIRIGMNHQATASYISTASEKEGGLQAAIVNGYDEVLTQLENQIPAWNVTTSIVGRHPLTAKIGKKEGVKNAMRFQAYKFKEDADGNLKSIPKGYLRATKIADNRGMATGNTKVSEFYQISGGKIDQGMLIKQKNDLGMGVSLGYKCNGLAPYNLGIDYLAYINTKGFAHYVLLNIGYDVFTGSKIRDEVGKHLESDAFADLTKLTDDGISYINFGIGYGFGIRAIRHVELVPFIMGGGDYMLNHAELLDEESGEETEASFSDKVAWFGNAGLRVNFNVKYPLQLFVQADYTVMFIKDDSYYKAFNDLLKVGDLGHKNSFGVMFGVKWTF